MERQRPIVQICFTLKNSTPLDGIRQKMLEAKTRLDQSYGKNGYVVKSCHLSREICRDKGFAPDVHDMFDDVFGDGGYECELTERTFDEAMKNIRRHRERLAMKADRLVILSETPLTNMSLEIELFTSSRVLVV